jgi:hypothetical protein
LKRPIADGESSICVRGEAGVVGDGGRDHDQQVGLVHEPGRDRSAGPAEHAGAEWVVVRHESLGTERRQDRRTQALGEFRDLVRRGACALPDDDDRPASGFDRLHGLLDSTRCWGCRPNGVASLRKRRFVARGQVLDLVR